MAGRVVHQRGEPQETREQHRQQVLERRLGHPVVDLTVRHRVFAQTLDEVRTALALGFDEGEKFGVVLNLVVHVDDETRDRRIFAVDAHGHVERRRESIDQGAVRLDSLFDLGVDVLLHLFEHGGVEVDLRGEVVIDRRGSQSGNFGDLGVRGAFETVFAETLAGGGQQAGTRFHRVGIARTTQLARRCVLRHALTPLLPTGKATSRVRPSCGRTDPGRRACRT